MREELSVRYCADRCSICAEFFCAPKYDKGGYADDMGSIKQYEQVYRLYANDVYRLSLYLVQDENKAKKITQQAFANIYTKWDEIDKNSIYSQLLIETKKLAENKDAKEKGK